MSRACASRVIFITGTDTGVGKTLLTGLLLHHLRQSGCHALAMKPFASGSRADTAFLCAVQDHELTPEEITPFYSAKPIAPLAAARKHRQTIRLPEVLPPIQRIANRCQCLLIEGIGGLYVPLGQWFTVRDLIARLACEVIVVGRNRLGTINHTLLIAAALQHVEIKGLTTVLMTSQKRDSSTPSNRWILAELLAPSPVFAIGFLGRNPLHLEALKENAKESKKNLARILASSNVRPLRSL
jgi:dethiobiotin synthetase